MFRGFCLFKCTKCGSMRTRPAGLFGKLYERVYKIIWEGYEEESKR